MILSSGLSFSRNKTVCLLAERRPNHIAACPDTSVVIPRPYRHGRATKEESIHAAQQTATKNSPPLKVRVGKYFGRSFRPCWCLEIVLHNFHQQELFLAGGLCCLAQASTPARAKTAYKRLLHKVCDMECYSSTKIVLPQRSFLYVPTLLPLSS